MKGIDTYISEKLHINKDVKDPYNYHPKDKDDLIECIKDKIEKEGYGTKNNPLDLNDIDTSKITDMSYLFDKSDGSLRGLSKNGYFDVSSWDVSNVRYMKYMFFNSYFNGDISDWNVRNVESMLSMFAYSSFNGNISDWNVSNVEDMNSIFFECPLQKNPPKWYK